MFTDRIGKALSLTLNLTVQLQHLKSNKYLNILFNS